MTREEKSNGTGDRALTFELQETLVNIERSQFRMFVHPAFLCTNSLFGLHIVDHVSLSLLEDSFRKNGEAGISSGSGTHL